MSEQLLSHCPACYNGSMESVSEEAISVKAFLHRQWEDSPTEVRRFPFPAKRPLSIAELATKVVSVFQDVQKTSLKIHWKGKPFVILDWLIIHSIQFNYLYTIQYHA